MSASKEKRNRNLERSEGLSKKATAEAEQARKNKKYMRRAIIAVAVIVVLVAAALVINSDLLYTRTTAVKVGDVKYSPSDVNYFFKNTLLSTYNTIVDQYGEDTASLVLDPNKSLKEQPYSGDQSWADVLMETAIQDMQRTTIYAEAADRAGYTLSEDGQRIVEETVSSMDSAAASYGYPNTAKWLAAYFGKGMDLSRFTELVSRSTLAQEYASKILEDMTYTDEELDAYYAEHADELDYYDYFYYTIPTSLPVFSEIEDADAKLAAAHEAAEKIATATTREEFHALVDEFTGEENTYFQPGHSTYDTINTLYSDWITDPARVAGDHTVVDTEGSAIALLFLGRDDNDYDTVNMRHMLISAEADEDGNITAEALETAETYCNNLYDRWQKDPTMENFSALAAQFSDDSGSSSNGGLYSNVKKGSMVENINDFLYNEGREPGDSAVVFGSNGNYSGYHVVYFDSFGENNRHLLARETKQTEDFNAKFEAFSEGYDVTTTRNMKYTSVY